MCIEYESRESSYLQIIGRRQNAVRNDFEVNEMKMINFRITSF